MAITFRLPSRRAQRKAGTTRPNERASWRHRITLGSQLLLAIGLLAIVGLVFVFSASSVQSLERYGSSWAIFRRQLVFVLGGFVVMYAASRIRYQLLMRFAVPLFGISMAAVLFTFVGGTSKFGSRRWITVGPVQFTPSELLKLSMILLLAHLFSQRSRPGDWRIARGASVLMAVSVGLVLLQPDMGTASIIAAISLSVIVVSGVPGPMLTKIMGFLLVGGFIGAHSSEYRWRRVMVMFHPGQDAANSGYHAFQSRIGFASGRIFGVGVGASRAKWGFLPNAHTDFIFTVIGEEVGLIGVVLVLALFALFIWTGIRVAHSCGDRFGSLVATGVTVWIAAQAAANMGTAIGVVPVTGVPLPFVSAGGTSTLVVMAAVGVLLNVARQSDRARTAIDHPTASTPPAGAGASTTSRSRRPSTARRPRGAATARRPR